MSKGVGGRGYWGIWIFIINMNSYLSRISLAEGVFVAKIRCSWFLKKYKKKFLILSIICIHGGWAGGAGVQNSKMVNHQ
jgi:hypothetical protein